MGGSSSSSSTSTQQTDARVAGDNGSFVVGQDSNVTVQIDETTPEAFATANKAIDESLDFGEDLLTGAGNIITDVLENAFGSVNNSSNKAQEAALQALAFADTASRSDETLILKDIVKIAIPAALLATVAYGALVRK